MGRTRFLLFSRSVYGWGPGGGGSGLGAYSVKCKEWHKDPVSHLQGESLAHGEAVLQMSFSLSLCFSFPSQYLAVYVQDNLKYIFLKKKIFSPWAMKPPLLFFVCLFYFLFYGKEEFIQVYSNRGDQSNLTSNQRTS